MLLTAMVEPLRHRAFLTQFIAQATSTVGNAFSGVAVAFGVIAVTGSARSLGWVLAGYSVPMLLLMVAGGVWADRLPRHWLMGSADFAAAIAQVTFGVLLISGHAPLVLMIGLQAVNGAAAAVVAPATIGLTSATVPAGLRQQANALLAVTSDVAKIVGPLIAGALTIGVGAGWALVIDGASFLVSGLLLVRLELPPVERQPSRFLADIREGIGELFTRQWLWTSLLYFAAFNFVFSVFTVLGPAQLAGRPGGALAWSVVLVALSIGSLSGSALATRLRPKYLLRWARFLELVVVPLILCLALRGPVWLLAIAALPVGVAMTFPDVLWLTALQQEIRDDVLSRVSSLDFLFSMALRPVGYGFASVFLVAGGRASLVGIAIAFALVTLASLLSPQTWRLARDDPSRARDASTALEPSPDST